MKKGGFSIAMLVYQRVMQTITLIMVVMSHDDGDDDDDDDDGDGDGCYCYKSHFISCAYPALY